MDGGSVFVVPGMPQLADYVYRDYQTRMESLKEQSSVRHAH